MTESETLTQFRANYGQLCVLVAKALLQGHSQEHVNAASRGKGHMVAPVYAGLRAQRRVTNRSLEACKAAGVSMREAVTVARDVEIVVQQEWMLDGRPLFATT